MILPLIGFDFKFAEGSVYGQGVLGDAARKQVKEEGRRWWWFVLAEVVVVVVVVVVCSKAVLFGFGVFFVCEVLLAVCSDRRTFAIVPPATAKVLWLGCSLQKTTQNTHSPAPPTRHTT